MQNVWVSAKERSWAFTCKNNTIHDDDYVSVLTIFQHFGHVDHVVYEHGVTNHRHIHGILTLPKNFHRKKLVMPGYHLHLTEITDATPWLKYLAKEQTIDNKVYMF